MKLSVIVATYNRKHELKELIESLRHQTLPPQQFEIVIVDDGSTDGTEEFIDTLRSDVNINIEYYFQPNRGPGYARTLGMEHAKGDVFIFIDSDCIAPPHYLQTIVDAFQTQKIDAFGGPDKTTDSFSAWDKAVNYTMTSFLTTGGLRGSSGKKLARYYPRSFNMGLRREIFERVGGFGSIYHYGEDIEFSNRILKSGARIEYLDQAYVFHKRRSSPSAFAKQIFKMGKGRIQLGKLDRSMLEPLHFIPAAMVITALLILSVALIFGISRLLIAAVLILMALFSAFLFFHGYVQSKDATAALFIPVVFCIQVVSYGTGMISEGIKTLIKK